MQPDAVVPAGAAFVSPTSAVLPVWLSVIDTVPAENEFDGELVEDENAANVPAPQAAATAATTTIVSRSLRVTSASHRRHDGLQHDLVDPAAPAVGGIRRQARLEAHRSRAAGGEHESA